MKALERVCLLANALAERRTYKIDILEDFADMLSRRDGTCRLCTSCEGANSEVLGPRAEASMRYECQQHAGLGEHEDDQDLRGD